MKLKELHALMQDIAPFRRAKVELEQYPTGPHLASRLLFTVDNSYDEFAGRTVADLGCGTAMLSIGAALLGARHVVGVDIDPDALEVAAENMITPGAVCTVAHGCCCCCERATAKRAPQRSNGLRQPQRPQGTGAATAVQ
ncbi:hypothetical protein HXX76_015654 [Chlamydomonas incerta]|uniref:Ribosomal protein L11 methyltransferase n=1 Tax=Chlamydomonas incerta TaxID=51695 RepID=A0A835VRC3_CHLIN|nr:hypothetical protein HXX76_015654 [Chlamydomonas incerta]|eukprot:KAG2422983.1 hypothetical protein HXX76_015654 [Chlamydomonas incerta]